jgi:small multidrug resistance family-3 protein
MKSLILYIAAAGAEIAGCFAFWAWLKLGKSGLRLIPGVASLVWVWAVEGARPDRWDAIGAVICLIAAAVILFGPQAA